MAVVTKMTLDKLEKLVSEAIYRFGRDTVVYIDVYEQVALDTKPEHYIDMDLCIIIKRNVT